MMRCGLFGKLPAKRDFIALHAPRRFLEVWEPWMQAGISASRQQLGPTWQQSYLHAPIWRFWLGADLCGVSIVGAFMPSLDGVGRYYPLTVFACSDAYAAIPPPEFDAQDDWFAKIEEFLLSTLAPDMPYDHVTAALDGLKLPSSGKVAASADDVMLASDGVAALAAAGRPFSELFASLRVADHVRAYAASTFWWTIGGEDYEPFALSGLRMPEPSLFAAMLTGQLGAGGDLTTSRLGLTDA
jgi:type VI secretion system protein ImpM